MLRRRQWTGSYILPQQLGSDGKGHLGVSYFIQSGLEGIFDQIARCVIRHEGDGESGE